MNTMEILELINMVDCQQVLPVGNMTESNMMDIVFTRVFGIDWDKNSLYLEFRKLSDKMLMFIDSNINGYKMLVSR